MKRRIAGCVALIALLGTVGFGEISGGAPYLLAGQDELMQYPTALAPTTPLDEQIYTIILPATERAVLLRPISPSEFGSYQIQAIAIEMIEAQMLAAALVLPVISESDVMAFPEELLTQLQWAVNEISGFLVFPDVLIPG